MHATQGRVQCHLAGSSNGPASYVVQWAGGCSIPSALSLIRHVTWPRGCASSSLPAAHRPSCDRRRPVMCGLAGVAPLIQLSRQPVQPLAHARRPAPLPTMTDNEVRRFGAGGVRMGADSATLAHASDTFAPPSPHPRDDTLIRLWCRSKVAPIVSAIPQHDPPHRTAGCSHLP